MDAAGQGAFYAYTAAGRLSSRTWARGTNTAYAYDTAGQLLSVTYNDAFTPSVTNTYDPIGRLGTVVCGGMTTSFVYDWANDVLSESYSGGVLNGLMVSNQYDADLRRTSVQLLNGASALCQSSYTYDNASRLASASDGNGNAAGYSYLANSPLVGQIMFTNSGTLRMTTIKQYDYLNRLISVASSSNSFAYQYNAANQRTAVQTWDGSYWQYGYDSLGQVTSGNKYWPDRTPVAGQQFDYTFDTIGNRLQTQAGGDQNGANLRVASYTNNALNQITSRSVPGYVDVMGDAFATNTVTVNGQTAYRKNEYFREQLSVTNATNAVWQNVTLASGTYGSSGHLYVPQTPETYTYDVDGNLLSDGRWNYTWDGENRLIGMTSLTNAPSGSQLQLAFTYDYMNRRIQKCVSTNVGGGSFSVYSNDYAYDGWNLLGDVGTTGSLVRGYVWGIDLNGSKQGAGGVGGLLMESYHGALTTNCFIAYDGNGNVSALFNVADGTTLVNYEYGPFGELIRSSGPMATLNPFRFSTTYDDDESDLLYYGHRYYRRDSGKWLNKDVIQEAGGVNLYGFVANDPITSIDYIGDLTVKGRDFQRWDCGQFNLFFVFTLNAAASQPGFFVQHIINTLWTNSSCCGLPDRPITVDWYEAFGPVPAGSTTWMQPESGIGQGTDSRSFDQQRNYGLFASTGSVKFIFQATTGDLTKLWRPVDYGWTGSGTAPASHSPPLGWDAPVEGPAAANIVSVWNCCAGVQKSTVITTPPTNRKRPAECLLTGVLLALS